MKPGEIEEGIGQKVNAVIPLGYEDSVPIIVDEELFEQKKLVFVPADPIKLESS